MTPPESLAEFLANARAQVDDALTRCLPTPPACPPLLGEALRYSVFAGGKRLRPVLALAAADAVLRSSASPSTVAARAAQDFSPAEPVGVARGFSSTESARLAREIVPVPERDSALAGDAVSLAMPAACALELIHTYSLVHDDLPAMDNDTLRRGRPTLHVMYGDGIAILAGDALQAEAFALLAREPASDDVTIAARKLRVLQIIADAAGATGMVGGQAIDLQAAGQAPGHGLVLDADGLQGMHLRKTGALIRASAVSGAVMAGAREETVAAIANWAAQVGLAFQIVDDILDVEGSAAQLGKTVGKDQASDKPTYPSLFGLDRSRRLATECAARAHDILGRTGLGGRLDAIADWIVSRRS